MIKLKDGSIVDLKNIVAVSKVYEKIIGYETHESDDTDDDLDSCESSPIYDNYFIVYYQNGIKIKLSSSVYNEFNYFFNNQDKLLTDPNIITVLGESIDVRFITNIGEIEELSESSGILFWKTISYYYRFSATYKGDNIYFVCNSLNDANMHRKYLMDEFFKIRNI